MDVFKVRLNCLDHYQSAPTDLDPLLFGTRGSIKRNRAPSLPVIRVFGSTETGQKVCAHVHGALPYLFIEYRGNLEKEHVEAHVRRLRASIDHALAVSYRRNTYDDDVVFVAHVSLVKGVPFFGYTVGYRYFLKIYLLNPLNMTRLTDLLHQGAIMGQVFQPFEAHLQYLAQWMCDYNLYGCAYLECNNVKFRHPLPNSADLSTGHKWHNETVPSNQTLDEVLYPRQSHCSIEVDIRVQDIVNRDAVRPRNIHANFLERLISTGNDEKLVLSLAGLWKDETKRRKRQMGLRDSSSSPFPPEVLISMSAKARCGTGGGWIHEEAYKLHMEKLIASEAKDLSEGKGLKDLELQSEDNPDVQTILESVQELYPASLALNPHDTDVIANSGDTRVDENSVSQLQHTKEDYFLGDETRSNNSEVDRQLKDELGAAAPTNSPRRTKKHSRSDTETSLDSPPNKSKVWTFDKTEIPPLQVSFQTARLNGTLGSGGDGRAGQILQPVISTSQSSSTAIRTGSTTEQLEVPPQMLGALESLCETFHMDRKAFLLSSMPPARAQVDNALIESSMTCIYQDAYYSMESDVPMNARDYAGRQYKLESLTAPFLPDFDNTGLAQRAPHAELSIMSYETKIRRHANNLFNWELADLPPSRREVLAWSEAKSRSTPHPVMENPRVTAISQIEAPTQKTRHGFKYTQKPTATSVQHETQYMSTMSLEVHVNTRNELAPDPEHDEIACIFWCLQSDENLNETGVKSGIIVLHSALAERVARETAAAVEYEETELDLINRLVDVVRQMDPDILTGYEVHNGSWGYLMERSRIKFEYNLSDELSRVKTQAHGRFGKDADRWGFNHTSTIRVTGRHMINIWRAMRSELNLLQYSLENVVFHLLHKRTPHYNFQDLSRWFCASDPRDMAKCIKYHLNRARLNLEILDANELIPRTSEQARLIGVDFFSVFSRGSQFKVESFMFRIAKAENFVLVSPSRKQVGQQNALECLPLVMEPQSGFYNSPLLVLDFQSLYPSIMIAYNYCYSTCLGRAVEWRGQNKMGFANFSRQPGLLALVKDSVNIAPNGMIYVKPEMRKSLLAKMLAEILETRLMVKSGMKVDQDDKTLQQLLNNRQLALKLLANVTYGYTSASFSGRMPCAEIADSIVQTAREMLEKAIAFIHSTKRWGAEVVYGDTDSLFVYLRGRSREEAFKIGQEIAETVTDMNPQPIKLKFEKVYHPCVLLAKKRYVGFKYESSSQHEPVFDAKGIETVRRDGTPAEQKIEETALKLLFRTSDLSQVKSYFQRQCAKIVSGKVSIQDFCFAREVKLGTYADKGPPPPGALISTRRMLADARLEPQYGERVLFVVITGAPRARLIDRCVPPETLLGDESAELDAEYYISKNLIPPLERIFNLVGANVRQWYEEMPKMQRVRDTRVDADIVQAEARTRGRKTLERYLKSSHCVVCRAKLAKQDVSIGEAVIPLCQECLTGPELSALLLRSRLAAAASRVRNVEDVCRSCAGLSWLDDVRCDSKDCPVFYTRVRARVKETSKRQILGPIAYHLEVTALEQKFGVESA